MKKFFTWLWEHIKYTLMIFIKSAWYVIVAVIIAFIIGWIFGQTAAVFTFLGIVGAVILYVWFRQAYWWFTGTGNSKDGGFPKIWKRIIKK